MTEISVIMLTYNREQLVSRMIECIRNQTFRDFEFIIVDNGSTDRSGVIADEYAAKDERVRVIHRKRGNIGCGRNAGLDAAKGKWIAFVDDDDTCEPDYLEFLHNLAIACNADIAICGVAGKESAETMVMNSADAIETMLWRKHFVVGFPTKLICHTLFKVNRFNDNSRYDDIYLMPTIIAKANLIAYSGEPKYTAYRHDNNNSAWTQNHSLITQDILSEYLDVYSKRTAWLCAQFPNKADAWRYFEWSFWISMVEKVTRLELHDCYALRDELARKLREVKDEFTGCELTQNFEKDWIKKYVANA